MSEASPRLDLRPDHWAIVLDILRQHVPDRKVLAFGSRATWTAKDYSDLDLAILGDEPLSLDAISAMAEGFGESNLPFKVDLVDWATVDETFRDVIRRNGVEVQLSANTIETAWRLSLTSGNACVLDEWRESTWGEEISLEYGKALKGYDTSTGPFRVFGSNGPIGWSDETLAPGPGVILGRKGAYRGVAYTPNPFFVIDTAYYVVSKSQHDMRWLFYAIKYYKLGEIDDGSPIPSTTRAAVYLRELTVPPFPEQHAIAHILGILDDKIELNRRMNETLETMARALFKSWFVDFDPVRAKMALNHSPLEGESQPAEPSGDSGCGGGTNRRSPQASRWGEIKRLYPEKTLNRAKSLRRNQTDAEGLLWHYLRNKQLDGYKFRRQQPIGPYIIDFACLPEKLLIELDGGQHAEHEAYDERRDRFLQSKGYRVLRFWNNEVFENCFDVLEHIYQALTSPDYSPLQEPENQRRNPQAILYEETDHHSPLEGESEIQGRQPAGKLVGGNTLTNNYQVTEADAPPPHQPSPDGASSAPPPQGGSDWSVERARAYLDRMDPKIADLFPDSLVDSELGEIPEGWEISEIGEEVDAVGGATPNTKEPAYWDHGNLHWATPKDLSILLSPVLLNTARKITKAGVRKISSGLLPIGTVLMSSRAPIGYFAIAEVPTAVNQGFIAMVCKKRLPNLFVLFWCAENLNYIKSIAGGSTFAEISKKAFRPISLAVPSEGALTAHEGVVRPLYRRMVANTKESLWLMSLRDTLLPKLISGELRVKESETFFDRMP